MYKYSDLKETLRIDDKSVECPILGCSTIVKRQRHSFKCLPEYYCNEHDIFISPTTFQYRNESSNIIITTNEEMNLLKLIKDCKRESRISRERSEDALTWNVFRYLEKSNQLSIFLEQTFNDNSSIIDTVFWSHSLAEGKIWTKLIEARNEFGEDLNKGSEPDLIIRTKKSIYFIESKFTSTNNTSGDKVTKQKRIDNQKKYLSGGNSLFKKIFCRSYQYIVQNDMYELLRFWLLGNWIAERNDANFHLVNLVREEAEQDIENRFGKVILKTDKSNFNRITWESIYHFIRMNNGKEEIINYFKERTVGYDKNHRIVKAFKI
ncbi:MAG: PGN_0703 family putative restriction endonuclease [Mobilitalea sp.]